MENLLKSRRLCPRSQPLAEPSPDRPHRPVSATPSPGKIQSHTAFNDLEDSVQTRRYQKPAFSNQQNTTEPKGVNRLYQSNLLPKSGPNFVQPFDNQPSKQQIDAETRLSPMISQRMMSSPYKPQLQRSRVIEELLPSERSQRNQQSVYNQSKINLNQSPSKSILHVDARSVHPDLSGRIFSLPNDSALRQSYNQLKQDYQLLARQNEQLRRGQTKSSGHRDDSVRFQLQMLKKENQQLKMNLDCQRSNACSLAGQLQSLKEMLGTLRQKELALSDQNQGLKSKLRFSFRTDDRTSLALDNLVQSLVKFQQNEVRRLNESTGVLVDMADNIRTLNLERNK